MKDARTELMSDQAFTVQAVSENSIKLAAVSQAQGLVRKTAKIFVKVAAAGLDSGGYFEWVVDDTAALAGTPTQIAVTKTYTAAQLFKGKVVQLDLPPIELIETAGDAAAYIGLRFTPVSEAATALTCNAYVDEGPESEVVKTDLT